LPPDAHTMGRAMRHARIRTTPATFRVFIFRLLFLFGPRVNDPFYGRR
jgi:hypothetical protein